MFIKALSSYICENFLYIMVYKYDIYVFTSYLVYRKEQSKIRRRPLNFLLHGQSGELFQVDW